MKALFKIIVLVAFDFGASWMPVSHTFKRFSTIMWPRHLLILFLKKSISPNHFTPMARDVRSNVAKHMIKITGDGGTTQDCSSIYNVCSITRLGTDTKQAVTHLLGRHCREKNSIVSTSFLCQDNGNVTIHLTYLGLILKTLLKRYLKFCLYLVAMALCRVFCKVVKRNFNLFYFTLR